MHNAIVIDQQRRQPNAIPNRYNSITYLTGIQMNLKKIKQTKIDEDDDEVGQQVFKNDFKFVF